ncbi:MAG: hypothetical protein C0168_08890 [Candidatus Aminicenantes bacterium]|nr:MAG: hypothetical protein C0168_08890 [Candidatus Aminicenantes bacterium]
MFSICSPLAYAFFILAFYQKGKNNFLFSLKLKIAFLIKLKQTLFIGYLAANILQIKKINRS